MSATDLIGSAGVLLLLVAFALNACGRLLASGAVYQLMNTAGAGLACIASWRIGYLPFVVLEGTWCLVAMVALLRAMRRRNCTETPGEENIHHAST